MAHADRNVPPWFRDSMKHLLLLLLHHCLRIHSSLRLLRHKGSIMAPIPTHICLFKKEEYPDGDVFRGQGVHRSSPSLEKICSDFKGRQSSLGSFASLNNAAGKGVEDGEDVTTRRRSWSGSSKRGNKVDKKGEGGEHTATTRWSSLGSLFSKRGRERDQWVDA